MIRARSISYDTYFGSWPLRESDVEHDRRSRQEFGAHISRGMFAGEVGSPRLLNLFKKHNLQTTWFIPGHAAETFSDQMKAVADAGHEIGVHGYSHENPVI